MGGTGTIYQAQMRRLLTAVTTRHLVIELVSRLPVGDCERAFAEAAALDGIVLARASERWLNQRGHLGLPDKR